MARLQVHSVTFNEKPLNTNENYSAAACSTLTGQQDSSIIDLFFASSAVGFAILSCAGEFLRVNQALSTIDGVAPENHIGREISEVMPGLAPSMRDAMSRVLSSGTPVVDLELIGPWRGDTKGDRFYLCSIHPLKDGLGQISALGLVLADTSDRRSKERAVRESEWQKQVAIESIPIGLLFGTVSEGLILEANDTLLLMLGYTRDEFTRSGIKWMDITPPEWLPVDAAHRHEANAHGFCTPYEKEYFRKDGSRIPILVGYSIFGPDKDSSVAFILDLTERKKAQARLRSSEERYRSLVLATAAIVWIADAEGRFLSRQGSWEHATGQPWSEHCDLGWLIKIHNEDRARLQSLWRVARDRKEPLYFLGRIWTHDQKEFRYFAVRAAPVLDAMGGIREWIGTCTDVHEQRLNEDEIRAQKEELETFMEVSPIPLFVAKGESSNIVTGNRALYGLLQMEERGEVSLVSSENEANRAFSLWKNTRRVVQQDLPTTYAMEQRIASEHEEFEIRFANGQKKFIYGNASPLFDLRGGVRGAVGAFIDVTDRKKLEEEKLSLLEAERCARADAERASRLKDDFIATLSHELRTPLNAILGWSQLIKRRRASAETIEKGLDVIERNSRVQAQLIDDLLDMSRIVTGKVRLEVGDIDLDAIIDSALASVTPAAQAKGIQVTQLSGANKPFVRGDAGRLQQIIWNLLSNAVKFTPQGGNVSVSIRHTTNHTEIIVKDSGVGIAKEFLPHVFERFRQADASTTRSVGGLGLGLAIVRHLVELHGGTVSAESEGEGRGTTFRVMLPAMPAEDRSALHLARPIRSNSFEDHRDLSLDGFKILVVDDEPDSRDIVQRILEEAGAVVSTATSADEALSYLTTERYDILVSDIGMPDKDGLQLLREYKAQSPANAEATAAIALTAFARPEDRKQVAQAGYLAHIAKPVEPAELLAVIKNMKER